LSDIVSALLAILGNDSGACGCTSICVRARDVVFEAG
jgi:hypothetical protein